MNAQPSSSRQQPKPLLVLQVESHLTTERMQEIQRSLQPLAAQIGAVVAIGQPGCSLRIEPNLQALLDTLSANTESNSRLASAMERLAAAIATQAQAIDTLVGVEQSLDEDSGFQTLDGR